MHFNAASIGLHPKSSFAIYLTSESRTAHDFGIHILHIFFTRPVMAANETSSQPSSSWDEAQCIAALAQLEHLQGQVSEDTSD
jgi:hypothetical protein